MEELNKKMKEINKIEHNPFMRMLSSETISVRQLIECYSDFERAVDYWTIVLSKLIEHAPTITERIYIINNLYDEAGNGDMSCCHVNTFRKLIKQLITSTGDENSFSGYYYSQPVTEFINMLHSIVSAIEAQEDELYAIAVCASIEYTYITVSKIFNKYLKSKLHLTNEEPNHYSCHEYIDEKHSQDFFRCLAPYYDKNKKIINHGLVIGYQIMNGLYGNLLQRTSKL